MSGECQAGSTETLPIPPVVTLLTAAFMGRDNLIEVALGLIIGAGFSNVVTSLVNDMILLHYRYCRRRHATWKVILSSSDRETPWTPSTLRYNRQRQKVAITFAMLIRRHDLHGVGGVPTESTLSFSRMTIVYQLFDPQIVAICPNSK